MLKGSAFRIAEHCLEEAQTTPSLRRLFLESPITAWALAVFRVGLALGPQGAVTIDKKKLCEMVVKSHTVRLKAYQIQCSIVQHIGNTSI